MSASVSACVYTPFDHTCVYIPFTPDNFQGTLDAVLCGADSAKNADAMLHECYRLLRPAGVLVVVRKYDEILRHMYRTDKLE
jgi:ubiquinone/menaquinone biosynthesis C-methylase UbiE